MAKPSLLSLFFLFTSVLCLSVITEPYELPKLTSTATFRDLLNLLGTPEQAATVNREVAQQLRSCFRYLVSPLSSTHTRVNFSNPIEMVTKRSMLEVENNDDEQIWFATDAVQELVRLAIESGGNPRIIESALNPTPIPVPDVEGSTAARCSLTRFPTCRHFINEELNRYQNFLFELIVRRAPRIGSNVALNRFDLFHGHLFLTRDARIGILYHAKEYPAQSSQFPLPLGFCQAGSSVTYDASQMNLRNILWLAPYISRTAWVPGTLLVLDARPNGIIYRDLILNDYTKRLARTIDEENLGNVVVDSNYLNVGRRPPNYQLFIC